MTKMKSYRFQMYILQMVEEIAGRHNHTINLTSTIENCIWEKYEKLYGRVDVDELMKLEKKYKANHLEGTDLPSIT